MSAINMKSVQREFSQLVYRPDVCSPNLINELKIILNSTGLTHEYDDTALNNINTHLLINIIKHVCKVCYSNTCDEVIANNFFTFLSKMYTEHSVDDTVKRTVIKCIKLCPKKWQPKLSIIFTCQLVTILKNKQNLCEIEYIFKILNECSEQFPYLILSCIEEVLLFLKLNLQISYDILVDESFPTQKISAIRCIHEAFRFFLTAYKKNNIFEAVPVKQSLNGCFMSILDCGHLPMETLFNCCLSILYCHLYNMSTHECWKVCLDILSKRSELVKLGFCCAILNTFNNEELTVMDKEINKSKCASLYDIIMDVCTRNLNDISILISSSRVLFTLSKRMCTDSKICIEKHQLEGLITFLWMLLDHFVDGVRHLARDTMINLIKIKDDHLVCEILERLSICDTNSKSYFVILTILSDKVDIESIIRYLPNIVENLLHLMSFNNSVLTVFIHLMLNHYSVTEFKIWFDYWLRPLFQNADKLEVKHFEKVITKANEINPDVSKYIFDLYNQDELPLKICLIHCSIEKKKNLANNDSEDWLKQIYFETLKKALHDNDENIVFIAVNLILDCQKKVRPFTMKELELLKYFIIYNVKNEKSSTKQTNLSFIKKMLLRMKESQFSVTVRNNKILNTTITNYYTEFQYWFCNFCFHNLFSDANFSRRNFSLESLRLIQIYLSPLEINRFNNSKNVFLLLNCLWDTYEDNKILAKDILIFKNQKSIKLDNTIIEDMLKTSKILASSTSPPDCITAGYLLDVVIFSQHSINHEEYAYIIISDLMNDLKKEVALAEESLTLASAKGPMYGLIHIIRHILNIFNWQIHYLNDNWITLIENISMICLKCEKIVSIVVNDSSPEGIIPMDDLCQNNFQVTSQMVLLCCWRTTKESSLLLSDIVSFISSKESEFSSTLITQICSCLTLLLSETKHRGAFEQIYVAYLKVCSIMWKSPTLHKIPLKYLDDVLSEIITGLGDTFCVTRRSAGMPFIIQALICTNHDKRKLVDYTMEILIHICENKNITENLKIGVVHALNVLRALFRCSQLGELVGPFVSRAINVSIVLFNSSSWPIRNSSTLLLSALVNRVFGVPRSSTEISWKNRMTGKEFFQRYPELYETFLNEFKKFSPMDMRPSLYPTLLILARLYPSVNEATDCIFQLAVYIPYIFKCAQSPVMKTRMLAATSIAPQVTQNKLVEHLYITYYELTNTFLKENTTHGLLLQMFNLVEKLPKLDIDNVNKLVTLSEGLLKKYKTFITYSYVVQEVFLRCVTCLWLQLSDLQYDSIKHIYELILESIPHLIQSNTIGKSKYIESAIFFLFSICVKAEIDFSIVVYNMMKNKMNCKTIFEILCTILSENTIGFCNNLEKYKHFNYWNHKVLADQLIVNKSLIELFCQQCTIMDSLIDMKYLVLSNFTPALHMYFEMYESLNDFISKVFTLRRDSEITHALLCINTYLHNLKSLDQFIIVKLVHVFENIYKFQRSDDCKNACVDIIVDNYDLITKESFKDTKTFLKLWTIIIHYSEDDSEEVRKHIWRFVNKNTNCIKSFELLFDKFAKHFDQCPSAVLVALICWSYLDIELPQHRLEGQVFDGNDTSKFKEHTIRQGLTLKIITYLMNNNQQLINLKINNCLQEWIVMEWTSDLNIKPLVQDIKTVNSFLIYAKNVYSKISEDYLNSSKQFIFKDKL